MPPLVTNRCQTHGNAFPENNCPYCKHDEWRQNSDASKAFFEKHGRNKIELTPGYVVRVEELYQHFRARMLEELAPTLQQAVKGYKP